MNEQTTIKNVHVLDMRKTPKETFGKIKMIKNVNLLMVSEETAGYLPGIPSKNLNMVLELPSGVNLQTCMSSVTINASFLSGVIDPQYLLVMGQAVVEPDVTPEMLDDKLAGMTLMGKLICPEELTGILHAKAKMHMGSTISYPAAATLVSSPLTLDDAFLNKLEDGVDLVVVGSVRILDGLTPALLDQKLRSIQAHRSVLCRQEFEPVVRAKLSTTSNMTMIPTGHRLVEGMLSLDDLTAKSLDSERLFCIGDVLIRDDVDAATLDKAVDRIECLGVILCPAELKDVLKTKCNLLDSRAILYEGSLWYVDDDRNLMPDQFEYIEGKMTIVVRADLDVSPDVSPEMILDRVERIHNLGEITCQTEQLSAIEARLGIREGDISTPKAASEPEDDDNPFIGNANTMVL